MSKQYCAKHVFHYSPNHIINVVCPWCEIDRLKLELEEARVENSHLWVRVESGEAAAYEQGKAEARQEAAREAIEEMRRVYPKSGCYQVLQAYFKLEEFISGGVW